MTMSREGSAHSDRSAGSDREEGRLSYSKSPESGSRDSRSISRSPSRSRSRSRSHSRYNKKRSSRRSYSRSRSRSYHRSRSPYRRRKHYSRSRSRSHSRGRYSPGNYGSRRNSGPKDYYRSRGRSPMSNRRRHVGNRDNPEPTACLGVFGLSLYTQERDLKEVFGKFGPLEDVEVVHDRQTGRSRGFAFVYFKNIDDSIEAKDRCTGTEIDGRRIRVDYSITQRAHTPTPGIYLGKPTSRGYNGDSSSRERRSRRSPSPYYSNSRRGGGGRYYRSRSRSYSPRIEERKLKFRKYLKNEMKIVEE